MCPFVDAYAYCLMPNHFHFLIKIRRPSQNQLRKENTSCALALLKNEIPLNKFLENQISRMLSGYTLYFNQSNKRMGQLFKQGSKRVLIKSQSRLLHMICYIHHNPIHHRFTWKFHHWPFSSYNTYVNNGRTQVAKVEVLEFLGGMEEFNRIHHEFKQNFRSIQLNNPVVPFAG